MRVLIVHDRPEVSSLIDEKIRAAHGETIKLDIVDHYVAAARKLREQVYDVAIVDLTIPHLSKGPASYETARNLLREVIEAPDLNPPGDLIGITREPGALEVINLDIGSNVMLVIAEDVDAKWLDLLMEKLTYVARAANARYRAIASTYDYDVLIVCALDEELLPFLRSFETFELLNNSLREFAFQDKTGTLRRGLLKAIGRAGQAAAASTTQSLVTRYRPKLCLMSGICGAVQAKAKLGDCLVLENVVDWDFGKWKEGEDGQAAFFGRPEPISIRDSRAHLVAREVVTNGLARETELLAHAGEIMDHRLDKLSIRLVAGASGSSVIAHEDMTNRIRGLNESVTALDMEAYAFYHACRYTMSAKPEMLCVKAACDFANSLKDDRWHAVCSYFSSEVVREIITRRWEFER